MCKIDEGPCSHNKSFAHSPCYENGKMRIKRRKNQTRTKNIKEEKLKWKK
jgi:hypothetical protein